MNCRVQLATRLRIFFILPYDVLLTQLILCLKMGAFSGISSWGRKLCSFCEKAATASEISLNTGGSPGPDCASHICSVFCCNYDQRLYTVLILRVKKVLKLRFRCLKWKHLYCCALRDLEKIVLQWAKETDVAP